MFDACSWLERYCKLRNMDVDKISDDEWEKLEQHLENDVDDYMDAVEDELMNDFGHNLDKFKTQSKGEIKE